ncbi:hypothetical protein [Pengzhenrongella sp.]|jgi:hypothetical protein|uniref:hypothetical protein n=1 Tax=Pengzhenrongella sp. TaxID=2888820 RepID=UPI002F948CAB
MTTTKITMHPGAERDVAAIVLEKANEAAAAVGVAGGRSAEEIAEQLNEELIKRGMNLTGDVLRKAAAEIVAGHPIEFSGGL